MMPATLAVTSTSSSVNLAESHYGIVHIANDGPSDVAVICGASPQTAVFATGTLVKAGGIVSMACPASAGVVAAITGAAGLTAALRIGSPGYGPTS